MRIPLFPLNVVLLPGTPLALHIFELRYKLMIGRVVEQQAPFGVVQAREHGICRVGCTATVVRIIKTHEDGRMDIVTRGGSAFRIAEVHEGKPYLEATVELLTDETEAGSGEIGDALTGELRVLFAECYRMVHGGEAEDTSAWPENDAERPLAYQLAAALPLDAEELQELLEMRDEAARRGRLVERLKKLLPQLARIAQMRDKTAGNGHGLR